jgi:hypothetical protein
MISTLGNATNNLSVIHENTNLLPASTIDAIPDNGQNHPDWISFLESFESGKVYKKRVNDFLLWQHHSIKDDSDLLARLKLYFKEYQALKTPSGKKKYAPTAFNIWFGVFLKFWRLTGKGDLALLAPILKENNKSGKQGYKEKRTAAGFIFFYDESLVEFIKIIINLGRKIGLKCEVGQKRKISSSLSSAAILQEEIPPPAASIKR